MSGCLSRVWDPKMEEESNLEFFPSSVYTKFLSSRVFLTVMPGSQSEDARPLRVPYMGLIGYDKF